MCALIDARHDKKRLLHFATINQTHSAITQPKSQLPCKSFRNPFGLDLCYWPQPYHLKWNDIRVAGKHVQTFFDKDEMKMKENPKLQKKQTTVFKQVFKKHTFTH